jgi:hypothetical protein
VRQIRYTHHQAVIQGSQGLLEPGEVYPVGPDEKISEAVADAMVAAGDAEEVAEHVEKEVHKEAAAAPSPREPDVAPADKPSLRGSRR